MLGLLDDLGNSCCFPTRIRDLEPCGRSGEGEAVTGMHPSVFCVSYSLVGLCENCVILQK